ncbi:MAG: DUF4065 domain-containing protein [bacterium]|nr:DUF4065 domain-containing protein [bacterium]
MSKHTDNKKYRELIKYISARSSEDRFFSVTKLNKILFFSDFLAYKKIGASISGDNYHKEPFGPVPNHAEKVLKHLIKKGEMAQSIGMLGQYEQKKPVTLQEYQLDLFSPEEISIINIVLDQLEEQSATQVSDLSHKFSGWQLVNIGEDIPYHTVLLSDSEPSQEAIEYGKKLLADLEKLLADLEGAEVLASN